MGFRNDFVWGAATASYQIEGAAFEDGRGLSVWDECAHRPGYVACGANGDTACDHYHRWQEDIGSMEHIGLKAYRFSVSWTRVLPDGIGRINQKGLDFYDKLVDGLLEKGIEPYLTAFHWDYPYELYKKGGWLNPDSPKWFEEYVGILSDRLSDRVRYWMTINEPQCFIHLGHGVGRHAPGIKLPFSQELIAAHNVLLAHGRAVKTLRDNCKKPAKIGWATVGCAKVPYTKNDVETARNKMFAIDDFSTFNNSWWSDPVFLGKYPEDGVKKYEKFMPHIGQDDMKIISQEMDFNGVNIYQGNYITSRDGVIEHVVEPYDDFTAFSWPVMPGALYWGPRYLYERYKKPIIITENGLAGTDFVNDDGRIVDDHRITYTTRYLRQLRKAAEDGVDVHGYFHWSLLDNFEWAEGYTKRFGMIYVDYRTGNRILKDSANWYKTVIATNGECIKQNCR